MHTAERNQMFALALSVACAGAMTLVVAPVRAHEGPRIWIDNNGGQVATYTSDNDLDPGEYSPSRFFTSELAPYFGIYTTEFPGYEVKQFDLHVASGTTFGIRLAGPLLYFQSSAASFKTVKDAFPSPQYATPPQIAVVGPSTRQTEDMPQEGYDFFTFNSVGDHAHLSYVFLGNGSIASDGPNGVYLLPLQLGCSSLARSETYYLMLSKSASGADVAAAATLGQAISQARPGDANFDGHVDIADLSILVGNSGRVGNVWWANADFTADGKVNTLDFNLLAGNYDSPATFSADLRHAQSSVPEPVFLPAYLLCGCFLRRRGAGNPRGLRK